MHDIADASMSRAQSPAMTGGKLRSALKPELKAMERFQTLFYRFCGFGFVVRVLVLCSRARLDSATAFTHRRWHPLPPPKKVTCVPEARPQLACCSMKLPYYI
jgi:hypothetical protein